MDFLYAFIENISWIDIPILCMISGLLIVSIVFRATNDMDKDDWILIMRWLTPMFLLFLVLSCLPSLDHVMRIKERINPKQIEVKSETIYCPNFVLDSSGLRSSRTN